LLGKKNDFVGQAFYPDNQRYLRSINTCGYTLAAEGDVAFKTKREIPIAMVGPGHCLEKINQG
jgi:hypothetical protein